MFYIFLNLALIITLTKGETLNLLYVVDFWKMLWHRCTLNRKKKCKYQTFLLVCPKMCFADRVIWDFSLSLTVMTIHHNPLCSGCPFHFLHIVANAAPTFFTVLLYFICSFFFFCLFNKTPIENPLTYLFGILRHEVTDVICAALWEGSWHLLPLLDLQSCLWIQGLEMSTDMPVVVNHITYIRI